MLRITTFVHTAVPVNSQNYTNLMLGYPQKYLDDWPHRLRQGTEHDVPFVVEAEVPLYILLIYIQTYKHTYIHTYIHSYVNLLGSSLKGLKTFIYVCM
jgi:hypothetical protein